MCVVWFGYYFDNKKHVFSENRKFLYVCTQSGAVVCSHFSVSFQVRWCCAPGQFRSGPGIPDRLLLEGTPQPRRPDKLPITNTHDERTKIDTDRGRFQFRASPDQIPSRREIWCRGSETDHRLQTKQQGLVTRLECVYSFSRAVLVCMSVWWCGQKKQNANITGIETVSRRCYCKRKGDYDSKRWQQPHGSLW